MLKGTKVFYHKKHNGKLTGEKIYGIIHKTYKNLPWLVKLDDGDVVSVKPESLHVALDCPKCSIIVICPHCGEENNYREVVTDRVDNIITEKDRICNKCNELIDCWAYGYWESKTDFS